jgi:anti-sigma B factor antagonist
MPEVVYLSTRRKKERPMSISIRKRESNGVVIVDMQGRLTLGDATAGLREKIQQLVDSGSTRLILNLSGLSYIDSSGVGELIAAYTTVTSARGELKLLKLANHGHDVLRITKLYTVFETFEDEAAAVRSFPPAKPTELQARWSEFQKLLTNPQSSKEEMRRS